MIAHDVGYLQAMPMQHTMLTTLLTLILSTVCFSQTPTVGHKRLPDSALARLGADVHSLSIEGTVSTTGNQTFTGLPFDVVVVEDTMRMTMNGPFGVTAARIYAEPDSFVIVNYLMREVIDGSPNAPSLAKEMPIPLTVTDLQMLLRGKLPGNLARFNRSDKRNDDVVLFVVNSVDGIEYALVDTSKRVLRQYQRKNAKGILELNITFGDVRNVNGVEIPHAVDIAFDDRKQIIAFRFTQVIVNEIESTSLIFQIPPTFTRRTFR